MQLSDWEISRNISNREIVVSPYEPSNLQPASLDLRIGTKAFRYAPTPVCVDLRNRPRQNAMIEFNVYPDQPFSVMPHEFLLLETLEWIELPDYLAARLDGKSGIGRLGLFVHNAGFIDPGFRGKLTLEIFNPTPKQFLIYSGDKICQIAFWQLTNRSVKPYGHTELNSHYQDQNGAVPSYHLKTRED